LGKSTATGWLAVAFAGWKATMNGMTMPLLGMLSGNRSTGTSMATRGKGLGMLPSSKVNVVPA
jgi:hypothetical protein